MERTASQKRLNWIFDTIAKANGQGWYHVEHLPSLFAKDHPEEAEVLRQWLESDPAPTVDDLSEEDRLGYALMIEVTPTLAAKAYLFDREMHSVTRSNYNRYASAVVAAYEKGNG